MTGYLYGYLSYDVLYHTVPVQYNDTCGVLSMRTRGRRGLDPTRKKCGLGRVGLNPQPTRTKKFGCGLGLPDNLAKIHLIFFRIFLLFLLNIF